MTGIRHDKDKPRVSLISPNALLGLAKVMTHGSTKYEDYNWRKGLDWTRLIDATQRHLLAFTSGIDIDAESGMPHIDHVAANIMMLQDHYHCGLGKDDRNIINRPLEADQSTSTEKVDTFDGYAELVFCSDYLTVSTPLIQNLLKIPISEQSMSVQSLQKIYTLSKVLHMIKQDIPDPRVVLNMLTEPFTLDGYKYHNMLSRIIEKPEMDSEFVDIIKDQIKIFHALIELESI